MGNTSAKNDDDTKEFGLFSLGDSSLSDFQVKCGYRESGRRQLKENSVIMIYGA